MLVGGRGIELEPTLGWIAGILSSSGERPVLGPSLPSMSDSALSRPLLAGTAPRAATQRRLRITVRRNPLARTVAGVAIVVTFGYLIWRLFGTLCLQWWWLSIPLFVCDLHGAIGLVFYTIGLWDVSPAREPAPGLPKGRVAVLIPTYNEPPEVILPTIAAAVALEPAHETWVLDDGRRGEIRALAAKLGARYLTRPDNLHAKAGNINHALEVVDADIVAVLDADHVPTARFLTATLPYFKDDRIAFVQTPQDFYNHESFEHSHLNGHDYSEEAVFYQAIAPGKNRWGASFWCGTCALLRVEALRSIGGVATESVTEDVHTTIRLYRRGWRGVFRQEVLARGLAPHDAGGYLVQRNRWAQGGMQVLRLENPLRGPGLTLPQRIAFLTSLITWFDSWRTLAYLLIPIAVVVTGGVPVSAPAQIFMPLFITTLLLQLAAVRLLTGPVFSLPMSMIFEMVRLPAVLPATLAFILPRRRATFKVTPKGRTGDQRRRAGVPRSPMAAGARIGAVARLVRPYDGRPDAVPIRGPLAGPRCQPFRGDEPGHPPGRDRSDPSVPVRWKPAWRRAAFGLRAGGHRWCTLHRPRSFDHWRPRAAASQGGSRHR